MSDLWMILVLLGVSIVLGVVLFNWWQERKYRSDVEYRFGHTRSDVLDAGSESINTGEKKPAKEKNALSEDMEGWMSEPRVRGGRSNEAAAIPAGKIEPSFSVNTASSTESATTARVDTSAAQKLAADLHTLQQDSAPAATPKAPPLTVSAKPAVSAPSQVKSQQPLDFASEDMASEDLASVAEQAAKPDDSALPDHLMFNPASDTLAAEADAPLQAAPQNAASPLPMRLPASLHTAMDLVGLIEAPLGVMLPELEDMQAEIRTFPQHTALLVQSDDTQEWENLLAMDKAALQAHAPVQHLACALQLADRSGPVDGETLKRFQKSMETVARSLGLQVVWQGDYLPEQQALKIDAFGIEVDKAVEFHLMAEQGMFHATKLRGLAEASGMFLAESGRFELVNSHGQLEFTLRNYEGKPFSSDMLKSAVMTGVTFQLDIPTTPNSVQVFDHMVEVARTMAHSLNASMTDVNRKPIGDAQLTKIRQQLKSISVAMADQGILPGSSHAVRLFS